jgi:cathepsin A (carboxypeptidase C)
VVLRYVPFHSGFLEFNTGRYHYVFFESQKDPDNDPVNWWFNGGPGCSSMFGMLYEHGPFVFKTNSLNIMINEWAWNKEANVLYIETPGGVTLCIISGGIQRKPQKQHILGRDCH